MLVALYPHVLRAIARELVKMDCQKDTGITVKFAFLSIFHTQAVVDVFAFECEEVEVDAKTLLLKFVFDGIYRCSLPAPFTEIPKSKKAFGELYRRLAMPYVKSFSLYAASAKTRKGVFEALENNHELEKVAYFQLPRTDVTFEKEFGNLLDRCKDTLTSLRLSRQIVEKEVARDFKLKHVVIRAKQGAKEFSEICSHIKFYTEELELRFPTPLGIDWTRMKKGPASVYTKYVEKLEVYGLNVMTVELVMLNTELAVSNALATIVNIFPNLKSLKVEALARRCHLYSDDDFYEWCPNYRSFLENLEKGLKKISFNYPVHMKIISELPPHFRNEVEQGNAEIEMELFIKSDVVIESVFIDMPCYD